MSLDTCSVYIATPAYGGQVTDVYAQALWRTTLFLAKSGIKCEVQTLRNESLVTRARNILVADFLARDFTHLMFIDADIGWEPKDLLQLLAREKPVVCGAYPKKQLPVHYVTNGATPSEEGLYKVRDAGTGFMLIQRAALEALIESNPSLKIHPHVFDNREDEFEQDYKDKFTEGYYALFDTVIEEGRYLSEDYAFCRRWQEIGGEIYLDYKIRLDHVGSYVFEGELEKLKGA